MKSLKHKFLVRFDVSQKEVIQYGSLKLYVPNREALNDNERESKPTVGEVVYAGDSGFENGDLAVFNHNVLGNTARWIERSEDYILTSLPFDGSSTIYGKLDKNGNLEPMFNSLIIDRIETGVTSSIIIIPEDNKEIKEYKGVVKKNAKGSKFKVGQTILYYKYSDYELCYNVNGEQRNVIMVKESDIVAFE